MKTLFTLISITLLLSVASAQTKSVPPKAKETTKSCVMGFSEEEQAIIYNDGTVPGTEILIASLPEFGTDPIPVEIGQAENGSYTFKKHPSLLLPEYYSVVIIDTFTGKQFDLKLADSYTFNVQKDIPERFVLNMSKIKSPITAMR